MTVSRGMTAAQITASGSAAVRAIFMVDMDFSSGHLRMNSTATHIDWDNATWYGVGSMGQLGNIEEGSDLRAAGLTLTISGVDPLNVSTALTENYQGRPIKVYIALLNEDDIVIAEPVLLGQWRMDTMDMALGRTYTITVSAESVMAYWNRPKVKRYTHEEQIIAYPGDMGLEFVNAIQETEVPWGKEV